MIRKLTGSLVSVCLNQNCITGGDCENKEPKTADRVQYEDPEVQRKVLIFLTEIGTWSTTGEDMTKMKEARDRM